ncbi:hypothetical protein [Piscirickettsia salmonis]|nr:hypothetical protein [Piscirickettsia salmonis]ERL62654.1 putative membrane protein [Piscirickettsia salmonis LF-89 = ATCC VR-1361]
MACEDFSFVCKRYLGVILADACLTLFNAVIAYIYESIKMKDG